MKINYTENSIRKLSNKGLILGLGLSIPMLIVSIYFIRINPFTIVWDAIPWVGLLIFLWIMWSYIWKEKTKLNRNISEIRDTPSDFVYELFRYSGFTFFVAMVFAFVVPILSIIFFVIGFWQIYYTKRIIDSNLLSVLEKKIEYNQIESTV